MGQTARSWSLTHARLGKRQYQALRSRASRPLPNPAVRSATSSPARVPPTATTDSDVECYATGVCQRLNAESMLCALAARPSSGSPSSRSVLPSRE